MKKKEWRERRKGAAGRRRVVVHVAADRGKGGREGVREMSSGDVGKIKEKRKGIRKRKEKEE